MLIEVYCDGSAQTAATDGGYGYVLVVDGKKHSEGSGYAEKVTNNDMELAGAIEGLKAARDYILNGQEMPGIFEDSTSHQSPVVTLISDSQIVLGWITGKYAFRQQHKIEKFKELQLLVKLLDVKTKWVKGHSGNEHNQRCDQLANEARLGLRPILHSFDTTNTATPITITLSPPPESVPKIGKEIAKHIYKAAKVAKKNRYFGTEEWLKRIAKDLEDSDENPTLPFKIDEDKL